MILRIVQNLTGVRCCEETALFFFVCVSVVSVLNVNSDRAEHVNNAECKGQRSRDAQERQIDDRPVKSKTTRQGAADEEKKESNEELGAFANGGEKWAARRGVPDFEQW